MYHLIEVTDHPLALLVTLLVPDLIDQERVDAAAEEWFALQEAEESRDWVLCFAGLPALSSFAIGRLITLHRRMQRMHCQLYLCEMGPAVVEMFSSSRLDTYFKIVPTRDQALAALASRDPAAPPATE